MKTEIKKTGDTIIVSMNGRLDFETHVPLREDLTKLIDQNEKNAVPSKIIFNFEKLEFVGSSGISSFVQLLKDFNSASSTRPRYCNVKSEFRKIIKAFDVAEIFEFHESEDRARKSFDQ
jgi:anti-anti-sigma factor